MKKLFNFYIEEEAEAKAKAMLKELMPDATKGALAAYLRVCVNELVEGRASRDILSKMIDEYVYSQVKNKRSVM